MAPFRRVLTASALCLPCFSVSAQSVLSESEFQRLTPAVGGRMDCTIRPSRMVELSSPVDGILKEVLVRPGQQVAAGDVIARLDTDLVSADLSVVGQRAKSAGGLDVAKERLRIAQSNFNRQSKACPASAPTGQHGLIL